MKTRLPLLALTLAAASCASNPGAPIELIELYDVAAPGGVIELELERTGEFREMEAEIPVDALPAHILEAAKKRAPGGLITGAEREQTLHGPGYEVKMSFEGREWELVYRDDGTLLETEKQLYTHEAPPEVLKAAEAAEPGSLFKSVELITRGEHSEYHVKRTRNGASYKMVIAPDGKVLRHVREARAELEIPVR